MATHIESDLLVVGAGIAGPALACALAPTGLRITLIERSDEPLDTARGDHLQPITLEILERWGMWPELLALGAERRDRTRWFDGAGRVLLDVPVAELPVPHPYFFFLNHERIGELLLRGAARNPGFRLCRPVKRWTAERHEHGHALRLKMRDGEELQVSAALLVGADGTRSQVRKLAGIEVETHPYVNPIGVMFGRFGEPNEGNGLRAYLNGDRMVAVIPRTGGWCKLGLALSAAEIREWRALDAAEVGRRMRRLVPDIRVEDISFSAVYPPVYLRTDRWVADRTVLLGDACHAMHPARSLGMNTAIRCVDELAKRLPLTGGALDTGSLNAALDDYDASVRPGVDRDLEENHRAGLEMDNADRRSFDELAGALEALQASPEARRRYAINAAGYAGLLD
ncbi:MAG: NAD-binding protein [Xanthomonadales bacterium]|uniref:FAD-dependent oxidoreductase n=1 Tax=Hydrogenophaga sp. TaxID=1904254 RepID=UPI0016BA9B6D|nr:NAD(P)/FAD-dependent oxidoreductase [Hydrogenophaga sp.]NIM69015.1 NAD-binding protein [Xanthomonadales bacterium]NIN58314.1 NAD-binding protein [Xanthomonadales bacterium]NIN73659.1 NAD-binding protein [Xanthomonadales bacterium]NIO14444.1 NAD-binding protein [Xanthomonadales bacterium]NIP10707.1 NAD-binding protein [Xanthomonadales bacterium]